MTSSVLKLIAMITMVIDHVGIVFFPQYPVFRMIGRLSFPIFAFLISEGFYYTKNLKKYILRMTVFAVLTEPIYMLFSIGRIEFSFSNNHNVLFSFVLALLLLYFVKSGIDKKGKLWFLWFVPAIAGLAVADLLYFSYGSYGMLMIIAFYLIKRANLNSSTQKNILITLALAATTTLYCLINNNTFQATAVFAAIPLWFYNGKKGFKMPKYLFYIFYPAHLLVLFLIAEFAF